MFAEAADVAARFKDRDVLALARHGQARVLLVENRRAEGLSMLDASAPLGILTDAEGRDEH